MKWPAVLCAAKPRSSNSTATSAPVLCPHLPAAGQLRGATTSTPTYAQQNQRNQQKGYSLVPLVPLVLLDASRQGGRSVANHLAPKRHLVDLAAVKGNCASASARHASPDRFLLRVAQARCTASATWSRVKSDQW